MLSTHWLNPVTLTNQHHPVLVFVHGLLGDHQDWADTCRYLSDFPCLAIDWPGHGNSALVAGENFESCCQRLRASLKNVIEPGRELVLCGYSLGARIVMYGLCCDQFEDLSIKGALLEGGNFGLKTDTERRARLKHDKKWANRFEFEPIEQVLSDWYSQPVFRSLNQTQREALIRRRSHNSGPGIAGMLKATSLGRQPYLLEKLKAPGTPPLHYVCGAMDTKFSALADSSGLKVSRISAAGHNVHHEQPEAFAQVIKDFVAEQELCK